jgi:hypothetical protein
MMGRESQEGQLSVLTVVTIAWFIFGSVVIVVNMVRSNYVYMYNNGYLSRCYEL